MKDAHSAESNEKSIFLFFIFLSYGRLYLLFRDRRMDNHKHGDIIHFMGRRSETAISQKLPNYLNL